MSTQEDPDTSSTTFEATITNDALTVVLDALDAAAREAVWEVTDDGVTAHAVDPATVLMCEVTIPESVFSSFEGDPITLGLRLPALRDAALAGDAATIAWDVEAHTLRVESGPVNATLGTLDPDSVRTQQIDDDVYAGTNATWSMPYDDFNEAVTVASRFGGDVVQIHAGQSLHGMRKEGDIDDILVDFADLSDTVWVDEPDNDNVVNQAEGYLKEVRSAVPNDAVVEIQAANDYPTITRYDYEGIEVTFLQAPRIKK